MKHTGEAFPTDVRSPVSCAHDYITIDTKERYGRGLRWKLGIATTPCIQTRKSKRCVFCGFINHKGPVSPEEVGRVVNEVLGKGDLHDICRMELYVSGSFFDDEEVSSGSRLEIIKAVNESGIEEVVLESRPEFITEENLKALSNVIDPARVTIAIGVETADDNLRYRLFRQKVYRDYCQKTSAPKAHYS